MGSYDNSSRRILVKELNPPNLLIYVQYLIQNATE